MIIQVYDLRNYGWEHTGTDNEVVQFAKVVDNELWKIEELTGEDKYLVKKRRKKSDSRQFEGTLRECLTFLKKKGIL